ncbi:MAG TPA: hypothetical protein VFN35_26960 [Ktedonobacteraceae bacterium]|nr:hypothetical protein [Ktedonobacteraceae bacterium]
MLCPSCNNFRPATDEPCPICYAPSPLLNKGRKGKKAASAKKRKDEEAANAWNNPTGQAAFWQDPNEGPQFAFPQSQAPAQAQAPAGDNLWMQVMSPSAEPGAQQQPSMLPVPYQPQPQPAANSLMVLPNAFPTINPGVQGGVNPLLPALPEGEDAPVYVAPMYTKPRPLIPRYRAISGLLSMIIVLSLLCGGIGYFLQATGKLVFFQQLLGNYTPPKVTAMQQQLPVPEKKIIPGPGWNKIIVSAAIGDRTDLTTGQVPNYTNEFKVGQKIFITCSAQAVTKAGQVIVKLYTNNNLYNILPARDIKAKTTGTIIFDTVYAQSAEGKVEIYWADEKGQNSQLAVTMEFVVQPL